MTTLNELKIPYNLYNLYLDDFREPIQSFLDTHNKIYVTTTWDIVRNYVDFVKKIQECGVPEVISFDHDLADEHYVKNVIYDDYREKTGFHCAKFLIEYCISHSIQLPKTILIHSMNYQGSQNIRSLFTTYYKMYPNEKGLPIISLL